MIPIWHTPASLHVTGCVSFLLADSQPERGWALAAPPKGKRTPAWELSLEKFEIGKQSLDAIALNQESCPPSHPRHTNGSAH